MNLLEVGKVDMPRAPLPDPNAPPEPETPDEEGLIPELPSLPVDIAVKELRVKEVSLGEPLMGVAADFGVSAEALWPRVGATTLSLLVAGQQQTELNVDADLAWAPSSQVLTLSLEVKEPKGGMVSRLADLPTLPAIDLSLKGEGPLSAWEGQLALAAGRQGGGNRRNRAGGEPDRRFSLKGRVDPSGSLPADLLPEEARPWLTGGAELDIAAVMTDELVTIERFELKAKVLRGRPYRRAWTRKARR